MLCGIIAFWKLECKCKRLLWTEYWYFKLFRLLWKFFDTTDVFDYLRFNIKTQDFVMRLPIKAQIRTQKCNALHSQISVTYGVTGMKNLEKREVRSHNKVR